MCSSNPMQKENLPLIHTAKAWVLLQQSSLLESTHLIHLTPPCKSLIFLAVPKGSGNNIQAELMLKTEDAIRSTHIL